MCRRWSGGGPFFAVRTSAVTFEGEDNLGRFTSSDWAERCFCKMCGSHVAYFLVPMKAYMLSSGLFDDSFKLSLEIFIDRKPDGYALAGDHPRWTEAETFAKLAPPPK
jgi:hypothetical protein